MRVLQERRRQCHAALPVELARLRAAEEVALHQAALAREAIEAGILLADVIVPRGTRPDRHPAVQAPRADDAPGDAVAELARRRRDQPRRKLPGAELAVPETLECEVVGKARIGDAEQVGSCPARAGVVRALETRACGGIRTAPRVPDQPLDDAEE